jgi:hypothetical protein
MQVVYSSLARDDFGLLVLPGHVRTCVAAPLARILALVVTLVPISGLY